jgi:hypothetical protein
LIGCNTVGSQTTEQTPPSAPAITSFIIDSPSATGTISGFNITVTVPYGTGTETGLTSLVATFATTAGASVYVDNQSQYSGITPNDFSAGPVDYTVYSADNSTWVDYEVTVTRLPGGTLGHVTIE